MQDSRTLCCSSDMIDDNLTSSKAILPKLDRIFSTYGVTQVDWLYIESDSGPPFYGHGEVERFTKHLERCSEPLQTGNNGCRSSCETTKQLLIVLLVLLLLLPFGNRSRSNCVALLMICANQV